MGLVDWMYSKDSIYFNVPQFVRDWMDNRSLDKRDELRMQDEILARHADPNRAQANLPDGYELVEQANGDRQIYTYDGNIIDIGPTANAREVAEGHYAETHSRENDEALVEHEQEVAKREIESELRDQKFNQGYDYGHEYDGEELER